MFLLLLVVVLGVIEFAISKYPDRLDHLQRSAAKQIECDWPPAPTAAGTADGTATATDGTATATANWTATATGGRGGFAGVDDILVLSLKARTDRRVMMQKMLEFFELPFLFVDAVDKQALNISGQEACKQSHLGILDRSIAEGKTFLVMEDDLDFDASFPVVLQLGLEQLHAADPNWDVLYIFEKHGAKNKLVGPNVMKGLTSMHFGAVGFVVRPKGAALMKKAALKFPDLPVDHEYAHAVEHFGLRIYVIQPTVVEHVGSSILSDVSNMIDVPGPYEPKRFKASMYKALSGKY